MKWEREIVEYDDNMGDGYQFTALENSLTIEVHSDWAGDTETGFGEACSFSLYDIKPAKQIALLLVRWIQYQEYKDKLNGHL